MIMKAHVGIGIAGKEGMQAARSADFAIGKFKFLRPLLFVHGREDYRRNADLILFTFYKNLLYVIVQYLYGIISAFSGQTLYEPWLYQVYNITYTAFPIMFYSLFDWERPKEELMYHPHYYKLGIQNAKFDFVTMFLWVIYSTYHAGIVLFLCFIFPSDTLMPNGQTFGFWAAGNHVYFMCIIFANLMILKLQNIFTGINMMLMAGHIIFFIVSVYCWQEYMKSSVIYKFWDEWVGQPAAWLGIILCTMSLWTLDEILAVVGRTIRATLVWLFYSDSGSY